MKRDEIDISGLDKAKVLVALFNHSRQQGFGFIHIEGRHSLSEQEAAEYLKKSTYFDYLRGRVMKVELGKDSFSPGLYDRDNGPGAAKFAIDSIR